jgi:hypothetical protein
LAARAADAIGGRVASQLAAATREAAERTGRVVDRFIDVTKRTERAAPIIASRVLGSTRFAPEPPPEAKPAAREVMTAGSGKGPAKAKAPTLDDAYDARASEIASSVVPGPDGRPTVRSGVRQGIASRLAPIAAVAPHVADRLETHAVRRLEFLAARMPRPTQIGMTRIRPPEMAIRAWARYVAAADDPGGVEERLVDGTITPEDAETMRELYPDRMAEITRMIIEELPSLRATLPYQRRLALSIFTGAPVDAAMDPRILAVLQAQYADERGTEGGVQAPTPQPAFGSIQRSTPTPTPAQSRGG